MTVNLWEYRIIKHFSRVLRKHFDSSTGGFFEPGGGVTPTNRLIFNIIATLRAGKHWNYSVLTNKRLIFNALRA